MATSSSPTKDLLKAAAAGDLATVKKLTSEDGVPVDSCSDEFSGTPVTPLWLASLYGKLSVVEYLLSQSAAVDVHVHHGMMPLHVACEEGHLDVVKVLMENGAKVDNTALDWMLNTPLHFAAQRGHLEVVRHLVSSGADVNAANRRKLTPLHLASSMNVADELLKHGASVKALSATRATPLIYASGSATVGVISCLLDHDSDMNAVDEFGRTAFLEAARCGNDPVVDLFLTKGVNINQVTIAVDTDGEEYEENEVGLTALMLAAQGSHIGAVKNLLKNKIDTKAKTTYGRNLIDIGLEACPRLEGQRERDLSGFIRYMQEEGAKESKKKENGEVEE